MPTPTSTTVRIVNRKEQSTLSKAQKAFNKLIDKIGEQREILAAWEKTIALYQQRYGSKFRPLLLIFNQRRRELVHVLDHAYDNKALSRTDKARISDLICTVAAELIAEHGDEALKPIYNRHSNIDFDAKVEGENKALKSMVETMLDIDLGDELDFSSREKMFSQVNEQLRQQLPQDDKEEQADEECRSKLTKSAAASEKNPPQKPIRKPGCEPRNRISASRSGRFSESWPALCILTESKTR